MKREIQLYTTNDGKCPMKEFLDSLPRKVFQKVTWVLQLLVELEKIPSTYFKKIVNSDNIWECRIDFSSNTYRIFCFFKNGSIIILTHGIMKKSQKTPQSEIMKAEEYKKDFLRRNK
ncbi:MAG: type II toxin-antitoxin system RelE/ParE family toxin [Spirochaetes bacterium]|nr:MAG: type II toxin-antitoxin system RelE/ParE family toxin [Spirochaetota bacterium]